MVWNVSFITYESSALTPNKLFKHRNDAPFLDIKQIRICISIYNFTASSLWHQCSLIVILHILPWKGCGAMKQVSKSMRRNKSVGSIVEVVKSIVDWGIENHCSSDKCICLCKTSHVAEDTVDVFLYHCIMIYTWRIPLLWTWQSVMHKVKP